jgi:hypothetical protein
VWPNKNPYIGAGGFCPLFRCFRVFDGRLVEEPVTARRWTSRSSSERLGLPHFLHTSDFCSQILRLRWQWQLKVPAALRVRFLRAARDLHAGCSACPDWSLQKLFKRGVPAQGESPAPRSWKRRATRSRRVVRRVCSELIMWYRKLLQFLDFETPPAATAETTRDDAVTARVNRAPARVNRVKGCGINRVRGRGDRVRGGGGTGTPK